MKKSKSLLVSVLVLPMIVGCGQQHSHSYDMNNLKWEWASDYSSCTVTAPCTGCDETKDLGSATVNTVNTAPTCENNGSDVHTATIVVEGTTYSDVKTITVNKLGHSIDSSKWLSDETNHWHKCEREGCTHTEAVANHEFGPWSGIEGTEKHTRACTICGKTQLGDHSWDDGVISKEPTHMTTGTKTYTCSDCGDTKQMTISKTLEHTFNLEVKDAK